MTWLGRQAVQEAGNGRLGCAGWIGVFLVPVPTIVCWWIGISGDTADDGPVVPQLRLIALGAALMFTAVWLMIVSTLFRAGKRLGGVLGTGILVGLFGGLVLFGVGAGWAVVQRFIDGDGELGENIAMTAFVLFLLAVPFIFIFQKYIPGTGGYQPPHERAAARRRDGDPE